MVKVGVIRYDHPVPVVHRLDDLWFRTIHIEPGRYDVYLYMDAQNKPHKVGWKVSGTIIQSNFDAHVEGEIISLSRDLEVGKKASATVGCDLVTIGREEAFEPNPLWKDVQSALFRPRHEWSDQIRSLLEGQDVAEVAESFTFDIEARRSNQSDS